MFERLLNSVKKIIKSVKTFYNEFALRPIEFNNKTWLVIVTFLAKLDSIKFVNKYNVKPIWDYNIYFLSRSREFNYHNDFNMFCVIILIFVFFITLLYVFRSCNFIYKNKSFWYSIYYILAEIIGCLCLMFYSEQSFMIVAYLKFDLNFPLLMYQLMDVVYNLEIILKYYPENLYWNRPLKVIWFNEYAKILEPTLSNNITKLALSDEIKFKIFNERVRDCLINLVKPFTNFIKTYLIFVFEIYSMQILMLITIVAITLSNNILLSILYLFFLIFTVGLMVSYFQLDLFVAFLWLSEFVVIFILIIFTFYLNVFFKSSENNDTNNKSNKLYLPLILSLLFSLFFLFYEEVENFLPEMFNLYVLWDDYYYSNKIIILTDLTVMFYSYFYINFYKLILFGFMLLISSLICVKLFYVLKNNENFKYKKYTSVFDFYKNFVDYFLLRKQNLNKQNFYKSNIRVFGKKDNNTVNKIFKKNFSNKLEFIKNKIKNIKFK